MAFRRQREEDEEDEADCNDEWEGKGLGKAGGERAAAHLASSTHQKHGFGKAGMQKGARCD